MQAVVLASGSQYRAQLLSRLGLEFEAVSPDLDESALPGESPTELATRLARQKAETASLMLERGDNQRPVKKYQSCLIIGSDQVASIGNVTLGKPGTTERACAQLARMSGQCVEFLTALHILDTSTGRHFSALDVTKATLRKLDEPSIARYVALDKPLDCAGSFKVEAMGISLFESVSCDDPTALVGLPLIKVCEGLRYFGMQLP